MVVYKPKSRYFDPDITVEGNISVSSGMPETEMKVPESEARYIYRVEYAGAVGHHGLLTTYCVVPLGNGALHSIHSRDLLDCWGEAIFEDNILEYASFGCSYEVRSKREVAAVIALPENDCCRSILVRGYLLE